jgi:hypothetical protein
MIMQAGIKAEHTKNAVQAKINKIKRAYHKSK